MSGNDDLTDLGSQLPVFDNVKKADCCGHRHVDHMSQPSIPKHTLATDKDTVSENKNLSNKSTAGAGQDKSGNSDKSSGNDKSSDDKKVTEKSSQAETSKDSGSCGSKNKKWVV